MNTPYMNLVIPSVQVTIGPAWATELNAALSLVDSHNHTTGQGQQVPSGGLNINADLPFGTFNATLLRSTRYVNQSAPIGLASDLNCLYASGGNLYFNNGSGVQIQLTAGGALNGASLGAIGGDYATSTASLFYTSASTKFTFWQASNTAALVDLGTLTIRGVTASAKGCTISVPGGLSADYSLVLPSGLPASAKIVTCDASGNLGVTYDFDNSTLEVSSSVIRIKALGVGTSQLADLSVTAAKITSATITGTQVSSNINLPGKTVQAAGKNVIVSNTNAATNGLCIIRGVVNSDGTLQAGEGFTSSRTSTGVYLITFTVAMGDTPVIVASTNTGSPTIAEATSGSSTAGVNTFNTSGVATNAQFHFIVIGQRA